MKRFIGHLLALLSLTLPLVANAASVRIQNANYDATGGKIIVKGVLDAMPATQVRLVQVSNERELGKDIDGNKQFAFQIPIATGQAVPCHLRVEAGEEVALVQVRHATTCDQQLLTLTGQVIDDVIPGASVTVTIGGVSYTTVADDQGRYSIDVATVNINDLVKIEAIKKMTTGETIELVSLAGTFSKLLEDSNGGVLSSDESQKVNVTNVSTAEFVLLVEANGGTAPTTAEELQQAETQVDVTELLQLAAVIKLIVDGDVPLPSGYNSALAFIEASQADSMELDTFIASNAIDVESMMVEILTSNGLVAGFRLEDIPSRYFVTATVEPGFLPRSGEVFEFDTTRPGNCDALSDGCTGRYMVRDGIGAPVSDVYGWYVANGVLEIRFATPTATTQNAVVDDFLDDFPGLVMTDGTTFAACQAPPGQTFQYQRQLVGLTFTRYNDGQAVDGLAQRAAIRLSDYTQPFLCTDGVTRALATQIVQPVEQVMARDSGAIAPRRFVHASTATGAADEIVADGNWSMLVYANLRLQGFSAPFPRVIFSDAVSLAANGAASAAIASDDGIGPSSWSIDGATGDLLLTYPDGWNQRVIVTDSLDVNADGIADEYAAFSIFTHANGSRFGSSELTLRRDNSLFADAVFVKNPLGKYWQTVVNAWVPSAWEVSPTTGERQLVIGSGLFGFRAAAVGQGFQGFYDGDGCNSGAGTWVRRSLAGFETDLTGTLNVVSMSYFAGGALRDRIWSALSQLTVNGQRRLYVLELERVASLAGEPHRFPPRPNMYREYSEPNFDRGLCVFGLNNFTPAP